MTTTPKSISATEIHSIYETGLAGSASAKRAGLQPKRMPHTDPGLPHATATPSRAAPVIPGKRR